MRRLSKSKLIAFRQCPKRLWLELHKPELRDDSGSQAAFNIGYQVGDIAQKVFDPDGTGINVDPNDIGWDESAAQTEASLQAGAGPVFEALLSIPGSLALADVMLPDLSSNALRWQMIEVKSSTGVKDYHRDDVAIQTYIAERSGIALSKVGVAHINNQFVYPGNEDYDGLLHVEDLTKEAKGRHAEVEQWIADAQSTAALEDEPIKEVGGHCSEPFTCGFCDYCWKDVPQPEIPTNILPRIHANKVNDWESRGITELRDAPDNEINPIQQRVKTATLSGETYFDATGAAAALAGKATPAYFLDFETVTFPVPIWKGTRPYQQLTFQFSLHRVDEDGTLHHSKFLDLSGNDPREAFVQAMLKDCGTFGPIHVYSAPFENTRIKELADAFPQYASKLHALLPRIVDLLPIARNYYYHPSQRGSWSIKGVLPAICPELSYADLEDVQHGLAAVDAYKEAIAPDTTPERKETLREQLLKYCELDTLATVKIWEFFKGTSD
ncbi:MAG: DUF2779 domain-containing protein [Opitutaceae bacterium]